MRATSERVFRLDRIHKVLNDSPTARRDPPADDLATWLRTDFGRAMTGPNYRARGSPTGNSRPYSPELHR